jgi:pimeloyl-ACP methyl ester carboxylesterase
MWLRIYNAYGMTEAIVAHLYCSIIFPGGIMAETPFIVVAGTFAPAVAVEAYYRPLTTGRADTATLALHQLGLAHTRDSAQQVHRYCQDNFGAPVRLAGHSQGANVAAWLWLKYPTAYKPPILLAGPWGGAPLCKTWLPFGSGFRAMATDSRFLREITDAYTELTESHKCLMTSIYGAADRVVHYATAHIPGANNLCIAPADQHDKLRSRLPGAVLHHGQTGHSRLPHHPLVRQLIDSVIADQESVVA